MIQGDKINLRLMRESDLEQLVELTNDYAEAGEHGMVRFRSLPEVRKRYEQDGWWGEKEGLMLIVQNERLLGEIVFFEGFRHEYGFEIGFGLYRREDRGRGYGTEALCLFASYLFEAKDIGRLHIKTDVNNAPARRIAEKCGFKHEGTFRKFGFFEGQIRDVVILTLLREDAGKNNLPD